MSRSPHLPPRCPPLGPQITGRDDSLFTQSCRFPSEDPFFGEPPCWLDDLLADSGKMPNLPPLRRACSDSDAILDALRTIQSPIFPIEEGDLQPAGETGDSLDAAVRGESDSGVEVSCVYGPNSPRQKCRLTSSESSIVNAVLENVPSNPLQYLTIDPSTSLHGNVANAKGDACDDVNHLDQDKSFKRRSGQRSRVRKLQYIADLERTVDSLQNMGADLAVRVASHFQLRNALSMENKQLRRQIASLQQAKLMKDGQTHFLKKETERLKQISARHRRSRSVTSCFEPGSIGADPSAINWQTVDMSKLSLNGSPAPVPPRGGYGL
ncbi:hypothetical protein CFC21_092625 [Triticum aestivum]|uniref:BZIP domain-containing protein n=4 Tax=Triticinae TaxID=1648030 RepID=A0A453NWD1_AEGTS|nr:basic leucine zipper 2 isoform X1 [Aegilops tauschii subsp. strangulata]XP_044419765.1 basic leucine zipper 2-like [Triticum aestivum]KAF7089736.1 hypothetical protein CFC21_092625 [Triticum aestivum]